MTGNVFYVYEHWRPDRDVCFWVGKGHGRRAYDFRRNRHYNNVVKKLAALGMCVEVRLVASGMPEGAALELEIARIAFRRSAHVELTNYTAGGEGVTGLVHSEETRAAIRLKRQSQKISHTPETRKKIGLTSGAARKGKPNPGHGQAMKGRKHSDAHRQKISLGTVGRIVSEETREKISVKLTGRPISDATRERLRLSHVGKKASEETLAKMRAAQRLSWERRRESAE